MSECVTELRYLMAANGLRYRDVAELALVSVKCVEGWLSAPGAKSHRAMGERDLVLIRHRMSAPCQTTRK